MEKKEQLRRSPDDEEAMELGYGYGVSEEFGSRKPRWWAHCPLCGRITKSWNSSRAFAGYVRHVRACADKCGASAKVQPRAASEARAGSVAEEIHEALALGPLRRGKIAKATGRHPMTIYYRCREMVERGELERDAENRYWLAGKKTTRVTAREVPENKKAGNGKALATATSLLHPKIVEALRGGGLTAEAMGRKIAGEKYSGVDAATQGMLDRAVERGELELRAGVYFLAEL